NKVNKTVLTNRYILNGEIYSYNPFEFDKPDMNIESDILREVFTNGRLCFYQKDMGMYVYQYNDRLYWVANDNFSFNKNGLTHIPYYVYTSQVSKLPGHNIQHGLDNLTFN